MQGLLDSLVSLLDLEELEVNLFRGNSPQADSQRVFGGQVLGQALVAAGRTVEKRDAHSFHAYFLRPGDPSTPILYQVERTRDGRSFTTRRVVAIQHGRPIFHMESSFQIAEEGLEHRVSMPDVPDPDSLPTWSERMAPYVQGKDLKGDSWITKDRPIDSRFVSDWNPIEPVKLPPRLLVWIRADGRLPDDVLLHQCVAAYASDLSLLDAAVMPHAISWLDDSYQIASLDHAMWFHDDFRADEWLLYEQESPAAGGARGFATGRLFTRDGRVVVSMVQEGLIRPPPDHAP